MDFIDKIMTLAANTPKQLEHILTEEATKNALVLPFINALGYNVFDPTEVVPELTADVGIKKGEKIDYAIMMDGKPIILMECKCQNCDLDNQHASQLYRYFTVTHARFAILTNGLLYRFYTDLDEPNRMDAKPFFEFNMLDFKETQVDELKKFSKSSFDTDQILATAAELKYTREIKRLMLEQMNNPSDDFVRLFASSVYSGRMTHPVKQQFAEVTKRALNQLINDRISERLKSALDEGSGTSQAENPVSAGNRNDTDAPQSQQDSRIVTTPEELEAYYMVKAIVREVVDVKRAVLRDGITSCSVLLDDTNRKLICRFLFHTDQKVLVTIGENREEQRNPIEDLNDIYQYADRLKAAIGLY